MASQYNTEPPPSGKLLFQTTKGDLEVELFAKECPLACRNIISLALEGYYDDTIFHRIVPGFIVQGGDPIGTGTGGESVYGENFADEIHQRLRFNRRGLLACANEGDKDTNGSQFFFTLDATPELQHRNTLFGRITGPTIYNLLSLGSVEVKEGTDEPIYPPKLKTIRVLDNPFEDIVPRITREEKLAQERARREAQERRKEESMKAKKGKKNVSLLSFGEAEELPEEANAAFKKGPMSSHDLLKNDRKLSRKTASNVPGYLVPPTATDAASGSEAAADTKEKEGSKEKKRKEKEKERLDLAALREGRGEGEKSAAAQRIEELEASIRGSSRREAAAKEEDRRREEEKRRKRGGGKDLLEEMRSKYAKKKEDKGKKRKDEDSTEEMLKSFMRKRKREEKAAAAGAAVEANGKGKGRKEELQEEEIPEDMREYGASDEEEGDPSGWRNHEFRSAKGEEVVVDDYVTLDPLDPRSKAAIDLGFGGAGMVKEREWLRRWVVGWWGRDWVDERGGRERERDREGKGGGSRAEGGGWRGEGRRDEAKGDRDRSRQWEDRPSKYGGW